MAQPTQKMSHLRRRLCTHILRTILFALICSIVTLTVSRWLSTVSDPFVCSTATSCADSQLQAAVTSEHDSLVDVIADNWTSWEEDEDEINWLNDHPPAATWAEADNYALEKTTSGLGSTWLWPFQFFMPSMLLDSIQPVQSQSTGPSVTTCNGHGTLVGSVCHCDDGWLTSSCSLRYDFSVTFGGTFNIKWTYNATYIWVQLRNTGASGWVGIIIGSSDGYMTNGDCWQGRVVSGVVTVVDSWSSGTNSPNADSTTNDIVDVSGWVSTTTGNLFTQVSFARKLNTGDSQDKPLTAGMSPIIAAYAYGSLTFLKHASSARGGQLYIDFMQPKGAPYPPAKPTLYTATTTSITIQWTAPTYSGSGTLTNYTVQYALAGSTTYTTAYVGLPTPNTSPVSLVTYQTSITGLASSTYYLVRVSASNDYYGQGNWSTSLNATTLSASQAPPNQPKSVGFVSAAPTSITVNWTAPATNGAAITGYLLSYAVLGSSYTTYGTTFSSTKGNLTGLVASTSYQVRVSAQSVAGASAWSNSTNVSTSAYPACTNSCSGHGTCFRSNCQCSPRYLGLDCSIRADFYWCGNAGANTWCLYWTYDSTYIYIQMAVNSTNWIGMNIGSDPVNGMSNADTWMAYVVDDGTGGPAVNLFDMWSTSTSTAPTNDVQYDLLEPLGYENGTSTFVWFKRKLNTTDSTQDKNITSGLTEVSWSYGTQDTPFSQHDNNARGRIQLELLQPKGAPTPPAAPTISTATLTSLTIQWLDSPYFGSGELTNYTVQIASDSGTGGYSNVYTGLPTPVATSPITYQTTITGLNSSTYYLVRVGGSNDYNGLGSFSTSLNATTLSASQLPPNQPNSVGLVVATPTTVTVNWTAPNTNGAPITGYLLSYAVVGSSSYITYNTTYTSLNGSLTGLVASTSYNVRVSAQSVAGASAWSNSTTVSTSAYPACTNGCSSHGTCFRSNCQCSPRYLGLDCSIRADFYWCGNAGANTWCLYWTYDSTYIYVQMVVNSTNWIGMNIGSDPSNGMSNADAWMAYVIDDGTGGQTVNLFDMWSASTNTPANDVQYDLLEPLGYETGTSTIVWFKRHLNTTDGTQDKNITAGLTEVSWSYGPQDTPFSQHDSNARGRIQLELLQPKGAPTAPATPTIYTATQTSLTIEWFDSPYFGSGDLSNYTVQIASGSGTGLYSTVYTGLPTPVTASPNTYQTTISGLSSSTYYLVRVGGSNDYNGLGAWSSSLNATTLSTSQLPPNQPNPVGLVAATPTTLTVNWTAPSTNGAPIQEYLLSYSTDGVNYLTWGTTFSASTFQATLSGLVAGTTYGVRVQAMCVAGFSPWSNATLLSTAAYSACPNDCSGHGTCIQAQCRCDTGFLDVDCARPAVFSTCNAPYTLCIYWTYDATQIYLQFETFSPTSNWYGWIIGPDSTGGMDNGDCWSFIPSSSTISPSSTGTVITVEDRWSGLGNLKPTLDTEQDLLDLVTFVRAATATTVQSMVVNTRRLLTTGDSQDKSIIAGDMRVSWAIGSSLTFGEHLHTATTQGKMLINFLAPFAVGPPTPPLLNAPIVTAATMTSVAFRFLPSALNGSAPITSYDVYVLPATSLSYLQSTTFTQLALTDAQAYVTANAINHVSLDSGTFSLNITGLVDTTCYPALLQANNAIGASNFSSVIALCTLSPSDTPPTVPSVTEIVLADPADGSGSTVPSNTTTQSTPLLCSNPTTISLSWPSWNTLLTNSSLSLVGYTVQIQLLPSSGSIPTSSGWTTVYTGLDSSVNITGLQASSVYVVRVSATNVVGTSSYTQPIEIQTASFNACPDNCSQQGTCQQGVCVCDEGFLSEDCSLVATSTLLSSSPYFLLSYAVDAPASSNSSRRLLSAGSTGTLYLSVDVDWSQANGGWAGLIIDGDAFDGMTGGDAWLLTYNGKIASAYDRYATSQTTPTVTHDQTQDLVKVSGVALTTSDRVSIRFQRQLATGDPGDVVITNALTQVSWAVGATQTTPGTNIPDFLQHASNQRGKLKLNFFSNDLALLSPITISYFLPMPIVLAIFCVLAAMIRNLRPLRQSGFFKTILHQPLLRTLNKYLNPFVCFKVQQANERGYRQHWLDVLTIDVRRTATEISCGEFLLLVGYALALIGIAINAHTAFDAGGRAWWYFWGDLTALHLALAILPVARTSIWLYTCGISFERAVKWHRWIARATLVAVIIHGIQGFTHFTTATVLQFPPIATPSGGGNLFGFVAALLMGWMSLMAIEPVRRLAFRTFYYSHLLFIIPVYVLACIHSTTAFYLCMPALGLYIIDRGFRFARSIRTTEIVGLEVIDIDIPEKPANGANEKPSTCIIHIQMRQEGFRFSPGQYIFLNIPQISLIAWHPFSISSSNLVPGLFSVHILSRRNGLDGLKEVAKQFQFGVGVGLRSGPGVVGIGNLPSSGNQLKGDVASSSSPPAIPPPVTASLAQELDEDMQMNPALPSSPPPPVGKGGRLPPIRSKLVKAETVSSDSEILEVVDAPVARHSSVDVHGLNWEDVPLNPFSWTSDLLIRSMRYFARCSSFVKSGNQYRDKDDFPPPPVSVRVDGPYGHINLRMKEDYHTLILIAGGIGITPFFSILYDLLSATALPSSPIEVVHLVWVCSDANVFHIIHPALWQRVKLNPKFRLHFFATRNARRSVNEAKPVEARFDIKDGRPEWKSLFHGFTFHNKNALQFARQQATGSSSSTVPNTINITSPDQISVEMQSMEAHQVINTAPASDEEFVDSGPPIPPYPTDASTAAVAPASPSASSSSSVANLSTTPGAATPTPYVSTAHLGVAAFACGPLGLVSDVEEQCSFHSVEFHKEVFAL